MRLGTAAVDQVSEYPIVVAVLEGEQVFVKIVELSVMRSSRVLLMASTSSVSMLSETSSNLSSRQDHVAVVSPTDPIKPLFFFAPHSEETTKDHLDRCEIFNLTLSTFDLIKG